jgi:tetratricopeptide (TPR) repeat protein
MLYSTQGQYAQAEPLYSRSPAIWEKTLGPDRPSVATSLNNLAMLYSTQGQYAQAEPLCKRSLTILGDNPRPGSSLRGHEL